MENQSLSHLKIEDFDKSKYKEYKKNVWICKDLDIDRPVYHYLRLERLFSLLETSILYFANRQSFADLREQGKKEDLKYYFSCFQDAKEDKKNVMERTIIHNQRKKSAETCTAISCWTWDSHYNGKDESYILWAWFGEKRYRIQSTIRAIIDNLEPSDCEIIINNVEYKKETFESTVNAQVFRKDIRYADEQEVRFCVLNCPQSISIPIIDISRFIHKVRPSPFMSKMINGLVRDKLTKQFVWLKDKFESTTILEKT